MCLSQALIFKHDSSERHHRALVLRTTGYQASICIKNCFWSETTLGHIARYTALIRFFMPERGIVDDLNA